MQFSFKHIEMSLRNLVNIGNGVFAQVQIISNIQYHEAELLNKQIKVEINNNIIRWFIPKD